jgi:hypothetical protein
MTFRTNKKILRNGIGDMNSSKFCENHIDIIYNTDVACSVIVTGKYVEAAAPV